MKTTSPLAFFSHLNWIDGTPLLDHVEEYRRRIFTEALFTWDGDRLRYNFVLCGRGAKNWKSADAVLVAFYRLLAWPLTPQGSDTYIVANDEGQAADDLSLAKKLVKANSLLEREVIVLSKSIERVDGGGKMQILPVGDAVGLHGKTYSALIVDEAHGYRDYALFEALKADPTRDDALIWTCSYDSLAHRPGVPMFDFVLQGKAGDDPRFYFSWYSGDFCTDEAFRNLPPEQRANPSMASWTNANYLAQQRRRLPTNRFRRLHLNLGGQIEGAYYNADSVQACVVPGRRELKRDPALRYFGYTDMAGGSADESVQAIAHRDTETGKAVLDCLVTQTGKPPYNPRDAVKKFAGVLRQYGLSETCGDSYAGMTFREDFRDAGIHYQLSPYTASELYELLEPRVNAGEAELLDDPRLVDQILGLTMRGNKITHVVGEHDDLINGAAGALLLAVPQDRPLTDADWIQPDSIPALTLRDARVRAMERRAGGEDMPWNN